MLDLFCWSLLAVQSVAFIKIRKVETRVPAAVAVVEVDAVAVAAIAMNNIEHERFQRVCREKAEILDRLRDGGFRVTKQRELILDVVFEHECASCKEIYYQAILQDPGIGMATVYRMINTLTEVGVLKVATIKPLMVASGTGNGCQILLGNHNKIVFNRAEWLEILQNALYRKGYDKSEEIVEVMLQ